MIWYVVAESASTNHRRDRRKRDATTELIDLQQQTLNAVNSLVAIQTETLAVKKAKLSVQQEMLFLKKLEMLEAGWSINDKGEWVWVGKNGQVVVQQGNVGEE